MESLGVIQQRIREFCKYCDKGHNGFDNCDFGKRAVYSERNWCGWSSMYFIGVITTQETIKIGKEEILRSDPVRLKEAIDSARKKSGISEPVFPGDGKSPLEKVMAVAMA